MDSAYSLFQASAPGWLTATKCPGPPGTSHVDFKPVPHPGPPQPRRYCCSTQRRFQASIPAQLTTTIGVQAVGFDFQVSSPCPSPAHYNGPRRFTRRAAYSPTPSSPQPLPDRRTSRRAVIVHPPVKFQACRRYANLVVRANINLEFQANGPFQPRATCLRAVTFPGVICYKPAVLARPLHRSAWRRSPIACVFQASTLSRPLKPPQLAQADWCPFTRHWARIQTLLLSYSFQAADHFPDQSN